VPDFALVADFAIDWSISDELVVKRETGFLERSVAALRGHLATSSGTRAGAEHGEEYRVSAAGRRTRYASWRPANYRAQTVGLG